MICRHCGTEIADKALICYRCGNPTTDPLITPPGPGVTRRPSIYPALIALVILVLAALFMGRAAVGETPRVLAWVLAALAAIVVAWRVLRRRRSP